MKRSSRVQRCAQEAFKGSVQEAFKKGSVQEAFKKHRVHVKHSIPQRPTEAQHPTAHRIILQNPTHKRTANAAAAALWIT